MIERKNDHIGIDVTKEVGELFTDWSTVPEDKGHVVIFDTTEEPDKLFIICHGNKDGLIALDGKMYYPESILRWMINAYPERMASTKEVLTISCYGGSQISAEVDGITIRSIHEFKEVIIVQHFFDTDNLELNGLYIRKQSEESIIKVA